jgi:DNA invertase Pin-like site-specific DNA recombinase
VISKNTPAGIWVRVSTGGQDEANQVPDIERHCVAHGYTIAERYELNDKSASMGQQQAKLDEMLDDMRDGTITVLVCWHSDRLERRGPEYVFRLLAQARDAGGRIESVQEPLFGAEDMSGEAMTALGAVISHQYSVHLGEQVRLAHARIKANGAVGPGGTPWGYRIMGEKYSKQLVPTDLCRAVQDVAHSVRDAGTWFPMGTPKSS